MKATARRARADPDDTRVAPFRFESTRQGLRRYGARGLPL